MNDEMLSYLDELQNQNLLRNLKNPEEKAIAVDFSSNDYLSLSRNQMSLTAGMSAAQKYGTGSTGSRLLSGNPKIFSEFEEEIANDKNFESALIFNSGYVANLSVISAFSHLNYLIIFDKLNHASMYQGIGQAKLLRFAHLNYEHLEKILEENRNNPKKLIASETVFGMDGDIADLNELIELSKKYNAVLFLDEAHATGLYGKNGYGLSTNYALSYDSTIVMGTFSKALASNGAYVACSKLLKQYLIQVSKGFIYSTALSPFCIGVAKYNWELLPKLHKVREDILIKADYLRKRLVNKGYKYLGSGTNIIPVLFNSTQEMLTAHQKLLDKGIMTSAIRRPTSNTPRLRLALTAAHSYDDIDMFLKYL